MPILTIPEMIEAAAFAARRKYNHSDALPIGHWTADVMTELLKFRASVSAAVVYWAAEVYERELWVADDFDSFADWLGRLIDTERQYTLFSAAFDFAVVIAPWLRENNFVDPWTDQQVTPEYLIVTAGYSKIHDVKSAMVDKERGKRSTINEKNAERCLNKILDPKKSRSMIDQELREEGLRKPRSQPPATLHNKPFALFDSGGESGVSLVVADLTTTDAEFLVSSALEKYLSLEPSRPADVFPHALTVFNLEEAKDGES